MAGALVIGLHMPPCIRNLRTVNTLLRPVAISEPVRVLSALQLNHTHMLHVKYVELF